MCDNLIVHLDCSYLWSSVKIDSLLRQRDIVDDCCLRCGHITLSICLWQLLLLLMMMVMLLMFLLIHVPNLELIFPAANVVLLYHRMRCYDSWSSPPKLLQGPFYLHATLNYLKQGENKHLMI